MAAMDLVCTGRGHRSSSGHWQLDSALVGSNECSSTDDITCWIIPLKYSLQHSIRHNANNAQFNTTDDDDDVLMIT